MNEKILVMLGLVRYSKLHGGYTYTPPTRTIFYNTKSKLEVPCHTPEDLYGILEPSAHYILLIFYNNGLTQQPSPLYMPHPFFYENTVR